ncbi:hemerythrin domain-containing protein [Anaeromyxobacter terrae]|uniref:hemerythrin domain-containing protein n=1 Tax=Anaeromyxobacter terrae TaxID=2925406 RepID=UPI001F56F092|nr:hemerythrin domain-containing protein [Anaeromyxobacter sp. SG22]
MTPCPELRRLAGEHARWRAEVAGFGGADAPAFAERLLDLWDEEILAHCRGEEDVLLPELAGRISEADAAIVFTLGDHVVLRRLARELRAADGPARAAAAENLARKLEEHAAFEERTLFPVLQETLGCVRLAELAGELAGRERSAGGRRAR